jgi:MEMO1 family protein
MIYVKLILCICVFLSGTFGLSAQLEAQTREPVVAGSFYPRDRQQLKKMLSGYMNSAESRSVDGELKILIVPHAGYIYSGPVAASAYSLLQGKSFKSVVVLALSHRYPFQGASIFEGDFYATPLGTIPLHKDFIAQLKKSPLIGYHHHAHTQEHSLEVHLPFLQYVFPPDSFHLVPIILGDTSLKTARVVAESLYERSKEEDFLLIVSTDLSHFEKYDRARQKDANTIEKILSLSGEQLSEFFRKNPDAACGRGPLVSALLYAEAIGVDTAKLLSYANSGDTAGGKDSVVGYASIALTKKKEKHMNDAAKKSLFSAESKREMFRLARTAINSYLQDGKTTVRESDNPELQSENGVFVTLHTKEGALRGCIGSFVSKDALYKTIQEMAVSSAFRDPRFPPVTASEIEDIKLEISVLSPMEKIDDVSRIDLGRHGIYIKKGFRSGTFLPQVATETGWNLEEFLGHCARDKAGIGWDGWKDADVFIYTADVFQEE